MCAENVDTVINQWTRKCLTRSMCSWMNKVSPWIMGPSQRFVDIVISLWTTECDICIPFVSRMWHVYSFCIPNVTYEHLLKTPNVTYELLWTPNVTYELLSINTECDKWIEDASRLRHVYLIESNEHLWNSIPIVWLYEHQLYEHLWTCILIVWMYEHLWTSIPCWFCCWIPTEMYTILMCWIPFDKYTMCYWISFDKYTMWMLLKTFEAMYNVNDRIAMDAITK